MAESANVADGSLTFVIPVQDSRGVETWDQAMDLLKITIASCLNQLDSVPPTVVLGMSPSDQLPSLPSQVHVAHVNHEWSPLPPGGDPQRFPAIRRDKGLRTLAAAMEVQPQGHVMIVDWDDLVSPHLGRFVAENPNQPGWYVESGLIFNDSPLAMRVPKNLHRIMGTSIIQRHDLMRIPKKGETFDQEWVDLIYGSHIYSVGKHAESGHPLSPLPFDGSAYRIGTGNNISGEQSPIRLAASRNKNELWRVPFMLRHRRSVNAYLPPQDTKK